MDRAGDRLRFKRFDDRNSINILWRSRRLSPAVGFLEVSEKFRKDRRQSETPWFSAGDHLADKLFMAG